MRMATGIWAALAVSVLVVGSAAADKYGELTQAATPVAGADDVGGLFWSATADCGKAADDLQRRQCEGIKAARGEQVATGTYVVAGDGLAFWVGEWNVEKNGLPIAVYGCIACERAVDVGGAQRFLTTKGDVKAEGDKVRGPAIHKALRRFKNKEDADKWKATVVPRLRAQFVVKLPAKATEWQAGAGRGYALELVGFRVWDPCDGAMVCSNPPSDGEKADRAACKGGAASGTDIVGDQPPADPNTPKKPPKPPVEETKDTRPEQLSSFDVKKAMTGTQTQVNSCFAQFGVPGKAELTIVVGGDGKVKKVELRGPFKDTPTGECIVTAVRDTEFPPFKAASMNINYPFILR